MSLPFVFTCFLIVTNIIAQVAGSVEARRFALAYLGAQLFGMATVSGGYRHAEVGYLLMDLVLLGLLIWITFQARPIWPAVGAALQFVTVLGHIARFTVPTMPRLAYAIMVQWTAWPMLLTILTGIWLDWRAGRTSRLSWPLPAWTRRMTRPSD